MTTIRAIRNSRQLLGLSVVLAAAALAAILLIILRPVGADAATLPSSFQESTVFSGLTNPTTIQFAKDGRVFVAEKSGLIKEFDNLSDKVPTTVADLRTNVYNFWDRGLLGMVLDPNFPSNPYVYVLYTYDAPIGGTAPRWGTAGATSDSCPTPPGANADGCVASGRLSRLRIDVNTNTMTGPEQVLIEDWCQQYPSHSVGSLIFGPDGALYVSAGDGASFTFADYGQDGDPVNPCGDPPGGVGATLTPPTAEGGALRAQDLRTGGDPVGLNGAILRVDPATGDALPNNPLYGNVDPNARRIIAYGLRNPFRQTLVTRPGTDELWVGDVGWGDWEEINRVANTTDPVVENFGWPCYEGSGRQSGYDSANLNICENLYGETNAVGAPQYTYNHNAQVVSGEGCPSGSSSIAGLAFYKTGPYPDEYDDALFFADFSRDCIWVIQKGANGMPDPATRKTFVAGAANPVDLQIGPNGDLFYVDFDGGTIRRIQYSGATDTTPPTVSGVAPADGATGVAPAENAVATFSEDMDASTLSTSTFTLTKQGASTPVAAAVGYDAATDRATLNPSADLETGSTYTATVKGGSGGAKDAAGNALASDKTWSFTIAASAPTSTVLVATGDTTISENSPDQNYGGALYLFADGDDPAGSGKDKSALIKWNLSSIAPGTNVGSSSITLNVSDPSTQTYTASELKRPWVESAATWNAYDIGKPWEVAGAKGSLDRQSIVAGTTTTPSSTGRLTFALDPAVVQRWVNDPASNQGIIIADAANSNGVDFYSREAVDSSQRPQLTVNLTATDTTPPTVSGVAPADGATGVAPAENAVATFSEDMDASTLSTSTFTLTKQGASTPVAAAVGYDAATDRATLNPSADLETGSTYTATVKGGSGGAKDAAGNALASDKTWSFTIAANTAPTAAINAPTSSTTWKVGDVITFSGSGTDPQDGLLADSQLSWSLILHHCPSNCHTHPLQDFPGVASGSFTTPDHEYPSYLELRLTATDSGGLTDTKSLRLDPRAVPLTFQSTPSGLNLVVGSSSATSPFVRNVIIGSNNSISAPSPQKIKGKTYRFVSWSDGGAQTHNITAPGAAITYTATYERVR
jgi:glucose/arabinose dehydrogenase